MPGLFRKQPPPPVRTGRLFVLSGPGGVGKTTVATELLARHDDMWRSVSATTRNPRPGEVPGFDYYFISNQDFEAKFRNDEFLEYAQVHDAWYGTPRRPVEERVSQGVDVLLIIDVQGGLNVKRNYPEAVLVFLQPPSQESLKQRLQERKQDSSASIQTRLQAAKEEMRIGQERYDFNIINDDLSVAIADLEKIMQA